MDVMTPEQRRKTMRANSGKGTSIERILAKALWQKGYRYRKNYPKVPGTPDLALVGLKIAIFCDGDMWHGKDWNKVQKRFHTNRDYWIEKIEKNMLRDRKVNFALGRLGWTVLRFWETEIRRNLELCVLKIEYVVAKKNNELQERKLNWKKQQIVNNYVAEGWDQERSSLVAESLVAYGKEEQ